MRRAHWPFTISRRFFGLLGILVTVVTLTPLVPWWATQLAGRWTDSPGDVLVVLAGSFHSQEVGHPNIIGHGSYMRAVYALRIWRAGSFRKMVITGDPLTAPAIRDFLSAAGVPTDVILVDPLSRSTHDHPLNCRPLLAQNPGRIVLLTSDYHMFRAGAVFRHAGFSVQPRPIPDVIKSASASYIWRWQGFLSLVEEGFKIVYYRYQGWI